MAIAEIRHEDLRVDPAVSALSRDGIFKLQGSAAVAKAVERQHALLQANGYYKKAGAKWSDLCDFNGSEPIQLPMLNVFVDPKVIDLGTSYLRSELLMSSTSISASIRTVDPVARIKGAVPFHQDRAVIGVERSLTFWYLVDPAETNTAVPGLDVVTGYRKDLARHAVLKVDAVPRHANAQAAVLSTDGKAEYYDMEIP